MMLTAWQNSRDDLQCIHWSSSVDCPTSSHSRDSAALRASRPGSTMKSTRQDPSQKVSMIVLLRHRIHVTSIPPFCQPRNHLPKDKLQQDTAMHRIPFSSITPPVTEWADIVLLLAVTGERLQRYAVNNAEATLVNTRKATLLWTMNERSKGNIAMRTSYWAWTKMATESLYTS
jgi:hypothetical protein